MVRKIRRFAPYKIAVLHGGPGALGDAALLAKPLAAGWGLLNRFNPNIRLTR